MTSVQERIAHKRADRLRPENYWTADAVYASGDAIPSADLALDTDALFVCDLIIETDSQGIIYSAGNSTTGLLVGINGDGDLVARFGGGGAAPLTNGARVVIPSGLVPKDRIVRLSVGVNFVSPKGVVVWIDGRIAGQAAMSGTLAAWAASADGAYIDAAVSVPTETGITLAFDGEVISALRYHTRRPLTYRTGA